MKPNMIDMQTAVRQIADVQRETENNPFFLIVGAGVSCPQVPLASKIVADLRQIAKTSIPLASNPMEEYSIVLEKVKPEPEQRRKYFEDLIAHNRIPPACLSLAYLLQEKKFNTLITPNFDDFISRALQLFGMKPWVYDRPESINVVDWNGERPQVVHVHGTYRDYDILNLKADIEKNRAIIGQLSNLLQNRSPVVLGYGGWPGDVIMAALGERLKTTLRYNLYWFCHSTNSLDSLPSWLKDHRQAIFVVPDDQGQIKTLEASVVLQHMIDAFGLSRVPALAVDPLGSFVRQLRSSLPLNLEDGEWRDLFIFSQRMRGFYPNRETISRVFHPVQVMSNARPGSCIMSAGRTLRGWAMCFREIAYFARKKNLRFKFLLSAKSAAKDLEEKQQAEIQRDRGQALARFAELQRELPNNCEVRETSHLIIDGLTVSEVRASFIGEGNNDISGSPYRLICQFDINAAAGQDKPTLVLACTCGIRIGPSQSSHTDQRTKKSYCTVHGLHSRTLRLFDNARAVTKRVFSRAESVAWLQEQGLATRRNAPHYYVPHMRSVFDAIQDPKRNIPPPVCVHTNVWAGCGTHCRMCDHWRDAEDQNLPLDSWKKIFESLCKAGVRTIAISGGEPLARPDIDELLFFIRNLRRRFGGSYKAPLLRIGLLTSGMIVGDDDAKYKDVCESIKECVDWVSVSIDGTETEDKNIRNPVEHFQLRRQWLERFCESIRSIRGPKLAATVTLQQANLRLGGADAMTAGLKDTCAFIKRLGIESVNFKLVTGGKHTLVRMPHFLISPGQIRLLLQLLYSQALTNESGNNLDYLRRCFAAGFFDAAGASKGTPLKAYYASNPMRCFTPYIFSVIDSLGKVYPCCHLYRDNHGHDPRSTKYREKHCLGNLAPDFDFMRVWQGKEYRRERNRLQTIDPNNPDYLPCGECTRHFQPNYTLNSFLRVLKDDRRDFDRWCKKQIKSFNEGRPRNPPPAVWF